jgi:uncharacterized membrane protein (UPF0136 family)
MQIQAIAGGRTLSIAIALLLVGVFLVRLAKTKKFLPSGLMAIVGISCLIVMLV